MTKQQLKQNQTGISHFLLPVIVVIIVIAIGVFVFTRLGNKDTGTPFDPNQAARDEADLRAKLASGGSIDEWKVGCSGSGKVNMTHKPMNTSDLSLIHPIGILAGAHVTPIDHLYFYSKGNTQRDANPVYAMADGFIVADDLQERGQTLNNGKLATGAIKIVVQHNCTTVSYYDLMTSLDPEIASKLQAGDKRVAVKGGQEIGRVGGQSLDTAIYNLDKKLTGFINPGTYSGEPWKIYTDDFFAYFSGSNKSDMLALNPRKVEPYGGKIDYDIEGKLIGNWYEVGTNGYAGPVNSERKNIGDSGYFSGHFSITPDVALPALTNVSFGSFEGKPQQFTAPANSPNPTNVDANTGIVKYELTPYKQPTLSVRTPDNTVKGTVLFQLIDGGKKLKLEAFPGKNASQVSTFTGAAKMYER